MSQIMAPWRRSFFINLLAMVGAVVLLQACGGGGNKAAAAPVVNADPTGYYDITGTASVKDDATNRNPVPITDLQGMVYNNHLYMISSLTGLTYDGPISVNGTGFTSNVTIYSKGVKVTTASIIGMIDAGKTITGSLTGTGSGNGSFALNYAVNNKAQSTLAIAGHSGVAWNGKISWSNFSTNFTIDGTTGSITSSGGSKPVFLGCVVTGTVAPLNGTHLYTINATVSSCFDSSSTGANGTYTGLATTRTQSVEDDTLVMIITDGNSAYSMDGELK